MSKSLMVNIMHIISQKRLAEFWLKHPDAETSLRYWYKLTRDAQWRNFVELKQLFPSADQVGRLTLFNVGGNKYRLIARVQYRFRKVYICTIMTHSEYDKENWKKDPWF
jgi:mRNA interferase HigB